jgi:hypothetical protein
MRRGRDEAGNIWELDDQGHPVRMIQPAQAPSLPGSLAGTVVPPNPAIVAQRQREQQRQDAADARAAHSQSLADQANARAAAAADREQKRFESEDTMAPPPGNANLTGEDYLKTIPPALAAQVRALSDGRRAFPTGTALRSPAVQQLIAAATQYDPTLDAANAATRVATRKKFTSGTTRDNITALNTALGHLGTLWEDAQKLNNFRSPLLNAPVNAFEDKVLGDPRPTNFNISRHAVADELEKAFRGTSGSQAGIDEWKNSINNAQSPDQLREAIGKAVTLLDSRLQSLGDAYAQGMGKSADSMTFLNPHAQAVFNALGPGGDGNVPPLPKDFGGAPPILGGDGTPPPPPPSSVPPTLGGGGPIPHADYSGIGGDPQSSVATGAYRNVYNPTTSAQLNALIHQGRSVEEANAILPEGTPPIDPGTWAKAVSYAKDHPHWMGAHSTESVPTTMGQRLAASPEAAFLAGAGGAGTAGLNDVVGRSIAGPEWDANRHALAGTHAEADMLGNIVGGVGGAVGGEAALAKFAPGALALGGRALGRFARPVGDMAYGSIYGASENPDDPLTGAAEGGITGLLGGYLGRKATGGLANVISPPAGEFGAAYENGAFPTIGQRFRQVPVVGKALNTAEQAMQSFPLLGAMVYRARELPRQAQKLGMVNDALGHIEPHQPGSLLPSDITTMGTDAQAHAAQKFDQAYDTARRGMQFVPDAPYMQDTGALAQRVSSAEFTPDQSARVAKAVDDAVVSRLKAAGGTLSGDDYVRAGAELGRIRATWAKDPSTSHMADALGEYLDAMDGAAIRNSSPAAGQMLQDTNAGYAKLIRLQKAGARAGGEAGDFTPKALTSVVQKEGGGVRSNAFNQGRALMQDDARALSLMDDTLPNSGSAERLLTGQAAAGTAGFATGAGGALFAHPGSLAPFGLYAPGFNKLVTRAIAPRSATLPPQAAAVLQNLALKVDNAAPTVGRAIIPGALAYYGLGI